VKNPRRFGKRLIWILVLCIPVLVLIYAQFTGPHFCLCHQTMECQKNMEEVWCALHKYAEGHDGNYPARLEDLHPTYIDLTTIRCPMWQAAGDTTETGYEYVAGLTDHRSKAPVLFCKRYHFNRHGRGTSVALFNVLLNDRTVVEVRDKDLRKYDGPMRRYTRIFRGYPYDGSVPTIELVRSLEPRFRETKSYHPIIRLSDEDGRP